MRILCCCVLVLVVATACRRDVVAPEKPCVPDFNNPDSSKTLTFTIDEKGDTIPLIRIAWCGPITVE